MKFQFRLAYYIFGLFLGGVFVMWFLKAKATDRGVEFCYLPNCRVLKDLRSKSLAIDSLAQHSLDEKWVTIDDIRKSNFKSEDLNQIYNKIECCLNETLERLDKNDFNGLILDNKWNKEISSSSDMFSLVVDEIFDLEENPKSTESIIKNLIKKNIEVQVSKIALYGNFTTGKLIERIIEMFAKKSIKLSNENIEDIKSFISQNFKNSKGKNLGYKEIKNKSFFNEHLKFIKSILIDCIKKGNIKCTEKDIARIIHKSLPELGELKTIENY